MFNFNIYKYISFVLFILVLLLLISYKRITKSYCETYILKYTKVLYSLRIILKYEIQQNETFR